MLLSRFLLPSLLVFSAWFCCSTPAAAVEADPYFAEKGLDDSDPNNWVIETTGPITILDFDRDLVVPEGVTLTLRINNPDEQLILNFGPENESCFGDGGCNRVIGKTELLIAGALKTETTGTTRILLTSTDSPTKAADGGKGVFTPEAGNWAGIIVLPQSDDLNTVIERCVIRNALGGVRFEGSSATLRDCIIENCLNLGVIVRDKSFPVIEGNVILNNGAGGINVVAKSSPLIKDNLVSGHENGVGITIADFSAPVLAGNVVTGNGIGVLIRSNSAPNLGRVSFDPENDPSPDIDPGNPFDDGGNTLAANVNAQGKTVNLINDTPSLIYAENNNWGFADPSLIAASIIDAGEGGAIPGLISNPGPVDFVPILGAGPLPDPTQTTTSTITRTPIFTATPDPSLPTPSTTTTPTETVTETPTIEPTPSPSVTLTTTQVIIPQKSATPTATPTGLPGSIVQNTDLVGLVRVSQDISIKPGVTVRVLPGTTLLCEQGVKITVEPQGRLVAEGTPTSPIFFIAPPSQSWDGIMVMGPDFDSDVARSIFRYCVFEGVGIVDKGPTPPAALDLMEVNTTVEHNEFRSCAVAIRVTGGPQSFPTIRRNWFDRNEKSIEVGLEGVVNAASEPGDYFNIGRDSDEDMNFEFTNIDPGFNVFVQPQGMVPFGVDIDLETYFSNRVFEADDNLFLREAGAGRYDLLAATEVYGSGRLDGEMLISIDDPPILQNILRNESDFGGNDLDVVTLIDEEVWAGEVVSGSPTGQVLVPSMIDVTILPGTRVLFSGYTPASDNDVLFGRPKQTLRVEGRLRALGNRSHPVVFDATSTVDPESEQWGGLEFIGPDPEVGPVSGLQFSQIRRAAVGVALYGGARTELRNVVIEDCGETAIAAIAAIPVGKSANPSKSLVSSSATLNARGLEKIGDPFFTPRPLLDGVLLLAGPASQFGLLSENAAPKIRNSAIGVDARNNAYELKGFGVAGVLTSGSFVPDLGTAQDFGNNLIFGNESLFERYEIVHNSMTKMFAIGNYWLAVTKAEIDQKIFDVGENQAAGEVVVVPFLLEPTAFDEGSGNLDGDEYVLPNDLTILLKAFLTFPGKPGFSPAADLNDDNIVNYKDFFLFSRIYGTKRVEPRREFPLTPTLVPTNTPTITTSPTITPTQTIDVNATPTATLSGQPTATRTRTVTRTATNTQIGAPTPTNTELGAPTATVTNTLFPGAPTSTPTLLSPGNTSTPSATRTATSTGVATATPTPTVTSTPTNTPTFLRAFPRETDSNIVNEAGAVLNIAPGGCNDLVELPMNTVLNDPETTPSIKRHFGELDGDIDGARGFRVNLWLGGRTAFEDDAEIRIIHRPDGEPQNESILVAWTLLDVGDDPPTASRFLDMTSPSLTVGPNDVAAVAGDEIILEVRTTANQFDYYYDNCGDDADSSPTDLGFTWMEFVGGLQ